MRVSDLVNSPRTRSTLILWARTLLVTAFLGCASLGCRLEYRTSPDGTYAGVQAGPPAGPLDPEPIPQDASKEKPP